MTSIIFFSNRRLSSNKTIPANLLFLGSLELKTHRRTSSSGVVQCFFSTLKRTSLRSVFIFSPLRSKRKNIQNRVFHKCHPQIIKNGRTEGPGPTGRDPTLRIGVAASGGGRKMPGDGTRMGKLSPLRPSCPRFGPRRSPPFPRVPLPATTTEPNTKRPFHQQ